MKSKPASGKPSTKAEEGVATPPKKVAFSEPLKRKKAASFPKFTAAEEAEEKAPSSEPLKRRRRSGTESESTLEVSPADPPPSGSDDVPTSRTEIFRKFENSQVPPDDPSETANNGRAFDEVAREALTAADEAIQGAIPSDSPVPPPPMMEDPSLSIEDLLGEEYANPASYMPDAPSRQASLAQAPTQTIHSILIILDDGK